MSGDTKSKMEQALGHFKDELKNLRTNRASPSFVESVMVDAYGAAMKLRDLANITTPEARQILITPFDPQMAPLISKGIEKANLGVQPQVDGNVIRINMPPMDESQRKEIVKLGRKKAEEAKVTIREVRRKENDSVKKRKTSGELTEDDVKRAEKQIQVLTDDYCKQIDTLFSEKEKEILTV